MRDVGKQLTVDALAMRPPMTGVPTLIAEILRALETHAPDVRLSVWRPFRGMPRLLRIFFEQLIIPLAVRTKVLLAPAYVAPLLTRHEVWLVVHDLHVYTHPETCSRLNRWHYRLLMPRSLRKARRVFVMSEHVRKIVATRFPHVARKLELLPVGIPHDISFVADAAACHDFRKRCGLPEKFFLFIGSLHPRKNLPRLMEAVLQLSDDAVLVIAGPQGKDAKRVECLTRALPQRFRLLNFVPQNEMALLYSSARALVLPSLDEGLGLPVLEALACHCPVLATPGPAQEFFPEALICNPLSVDSLANALRRMWQDDDLCHALSEKAATRAKHFSWQNTARVIMEAPC